MNKLLVTGGAGFIGSCFVRMALQKNPARKIVVYDKLTYSGNLDNLKEVNDCPMTFVQGDVNDSQRLSCAMAGCDEVVHFAAESHVDRSLNQSSEFVVTNVLGVHNLLCQAREQNVSKIVLVSSDEVYGSIEQGSFDENAPLRPRNPYSASKAAGDLMGLAFHETYGLPVVITRGSNTYGPYQHPEKVLPLFITNALEGKKLPLYGDGKNVRDWLYVEDHCTGIEYALRIGQPGQVYNISSSNEKTNIELTQEVLRMVGASEELICPVQDRRGHDQRYSIRSDKIESLGWSPETNWREGLSRTINWYKDNEWWWRKIKEGAFKEYYAKQYGNLLKETL